MVRLSSIIETEPIGGPAGQGPFLNAVAELRCLCSPQQLHTATRQIENRLGRSRTEKWGPRTIDLDLLLFADRTIDTPLLKIPHPRMHQRTFVIDPLAEIALDVRHPTLNLTIRQIQQALNKNNQTHP